MVIDFFVCPVQEDDPGVILIHSRNPSPSLVYLSNQQLAMAYESGDKVRIKDPEGGQDQYIVVVRVVRDNGDRHYRHFYGMGYSPKHAEDYVCSEPSYNLAQYHDYQIVEVVPLGQWA